MSFARSPLSQPSGGRYSTVDGSEPRGDKVRLGMPDATFASGGEVSR